MRALELDALYAISDLHLGGKPGFQIFSGQAELPALLLHLANAASPRLALVINGDFIDFLAEAPAQYFDAAGGPRKLRRIAQDPAFAASFKAFGVFVNTAERFLLINLGNHDLELCLPDVQAEFARSIGLSQEAGSRLIWVDDGTGVSARVAGRSILCLHGNEADISNVVDFEHLRRIKKADALGKLPAQQSELWVPNAGTQLVVDAMNKIKLDYPFVDVLKPETEATLRVLLALDLKLLKQHGSAAIRAMLVQRGKDVLRRKFGLLRAEQTVSDPTQPRPVLSAEQLMLRADTEFRSGVRALDLVDADRNLGDIGMIMNALVGLDTTEQLRDALKSLDDDRSFEFDVAEVMNTELQQMVGPQVDFLLSGHTHFERSLARDDGGFHFNSGTWAYLMRIAPALRNSRQEFANVIARLRDKAGLAELAQAGLLIRRHTVICITAQPDGGARGALAHAILRDGNLELSEVPGSARLAGGV